MKTLAINKIFLILLILIYLTSSNIFSTFPDISFYTSQSNGTKIKISPFQDKVAIGYLSGVVQIYSTKGYWLNTLRGHSSKIIEIIWSYSYGLFTLEQKGIAIRWSDGGSVLNKWTLNQTVIGMAMTGMFVGFNLGNRVQEYLISSTNLFKTYIPQNGNTFSAIEYSSNHSYLFVGYNSSYAQLYSCIDARPFGYNLYTYGRIKQLKFINNYDVMGLTYNNYMIKISYTGIVTYIGTFSTQIEFAICSEFIATAQAYYSQIGIYDLKGYNKQFLTYFWNPVISLDCSSNHLTTVDNSGYVTLNSYQSGFPGWAIGLIIFGACLSGAIAFIVWWVRRKRLMRQRAGYNRMGNVIGGGAPNVIVINGGNTVSPVQQPIIQPYFNSNRNANNNVYIPPNNPNINKNFNYPPSNPYNQINSNKSNNNNNSLYPPTYHNNNQSQNNLSNTNSNNNVNPYGISDNTHISNTNNQINPYNNHNNQPRNWN